MKKILIFTLLLLTLFFNYQCKPIEIEPDPVDTVQIVPPGVVIHHISKETKKNVGSPSICILPNGDYLASHDEAGEGTKGYPNTTRIYRSTDKGATWARISSIAVGQTWSNIFLYEGNVYVMGVIAPLWNCIIRKSTDNGNTWTETLDANNGLLMAWRCHTGPTPMLVFNNRIWRGMEVKNPVYEIWGKMFNAMIMSAPLGSDIMKSSSWTKSNQLEFNSTYLDGNFGGWLEGNAVQDKNGKIKLVMRVEVPGSIGEYIALIDVSDDGKTINFDANTGFVKMPGGAKKFTIRYDSISNRYWTLSNYVLPQLSYLNPGYVRNTLALCSSADLREWQVHKFVLQHEDNKFHGFQYVDWLADGNDMVFVSRTSYDDNTGGAKDYHDANYITFHKVLNFRSYVDQIIK